MKSDVIHKAIVNDLYELSNIIMGSTQSFMTFVAKAYTVANMIKLLDSRIGNHLLSYMGDEVEARNNILKQTQIRQGQDAFDDTAIRASFIANVDNEFKISIVDEITNVISKYPLIRL